MRSLFAFAATFICLGCQQGFPSVEGSKPVTSLSSQELKWLASMDRQIAANLRYDAGYTSTGVPKPGTGVCSDVILTGLADLGFELRKAMEADISSNPDAYGIKKIDRGIDHRRARNQMTYIGRSKKFRLVPTEPNKIHPGDIIFWSTKNGSIADHVGLAGRYRMKDGWPSIVHHWPGLPVAETGGANGWKILAIYRFN